MDRLPNEVIGMIVEKYTGPRLARLATISRRWQEHVEKRIFSEVRFRAWRPKEVERTNAWCAKWPSRRKLPEPECTTDDEDCWGELDMEEQEMEDEDTDGKADAGNGDEEAEEEYLVDLTISPFDSFKHVFEGKNSYRQRYLRRLEFLFPAPRDAFRMEIEDFEQNQYGFQDAVDNLLLTLEDWDHCKNLELCLIIRDREKPIDPDCYSMLPADPLDAEPRLGLKWTSKQLDVPFVTSFVYCDNEPFRMWPDAACGLATKFPNLRDLSLYFWDAEDHEALEYRGMLYRSLVEGVESLCGNLPRLRDLRLTRGSYYGIDEHGDQPKDFTRGTDRLGQAVRRLPQPTVRNLHILGFFLSRDFFCSPDSEGRDTDSEASDEDEWKALRHLTISGEIVGSDGKYFLKDKENWTSNVSALHWQGDATTLDPLVESFYEDVIRMPRIKDAFLGISDNGCWVSLSLSAERKGKGSDGLKWCLGATDGKQSRRRENFSL